MIRYDILICGIGGQGAISLGTALKLAAIEEGLGVVGAEKRGGAQREGVVTSNVRYFGLEKGEDASARQGALSGLIPAGGAHLLIAMEPLEALRQARYINEATVVIVNDFPLTPVHVRIGEFAYPPLDEIYARLRECSTHVHACNIDELSIRHFNSLRQVNTISLGMASGLGKMPVTEASLLTTIQKQFPDFETNKKAFELGMKIAHDRF